MREVKVINFAKATSDIQLKVKIASQRDLVAYSLDLLIELFAFLVISLII